MKRKKRTEGSILIDTMIAVLVCAIIMTALVPLAVRLLTIEASLRTELIYIFETGSRLW